MSIPNKIDAFPNLAKAIDPRRPKEGGEPTRRCRR
jgi:hypothetical protein